MKTTEITYKYHLKKYNGPSSRLTCPNCGRKRCFSPYVDENEQIVGAQYGRCDHESSCGYIKYPPRETNWTKSPSKCYQKENQKMKNATDQVTIEPAETINTIPMDIVRKTVRTSPPSNFIIFLQTLFEWGLIAFLINEYFIGVTRAGDVVFYQIDGNNRCRSGKIMKYDRETGHRIKDPNAKTPITWVHSLLKKQGVLPQAWELSQCLFGEHLLKKYPDKPVILVESEKTAIIGAGFKPEYVWVAVGGKSQIKGKLEVLAGRTVIAFPDVDAYDEWKIEFKNRPNLNIYVSDFVNQYSVSQELGEKADIADVLIHWAKNQFPVVNISSGEYVRDNSEKVMSRDSEIQAYFSPETRQAVMDLIAELELEVKCVTKLINQ